MSNVIKFEEFAVLKAAIEKTGYVVNDHAGGANYLASDVDVGVLVRIGSKSVSARACLILKNPNICYTINDLYLDKEGIPHLSIMSIGPVINPDSGGHTLEEYTKGVRMIGGELIYIHVMK